MNTVFKFYYQVWLFPGIGGAAGIVLAWTRGGIARAASLAALFVLSAGLAYAPAAVWTRIHASSTAPRTWDALEFLRRERPDEHAAIEWILANTRRHDTVVQAAGNSSDVSNSLISTATGRPTLLGWEVHERQWRGPAFEGMAVGRREALARIYTPESVRAIEETLSAWDVSYVYLGPTERARYSISAEDEARMGSAMDLAFEHGGVRIYRRRGE